MDYRKNCLVPEEYQNEYRLRVKGEGLEMYLPEEKITEVVDYASTTYEVSADKSATLRAIQEYLYEEFGIRGRKSLPLMIYNRTMLRFHGV